MLLPGEAGLELCVFSVPQQSSSENSACIAGLAHLVSECAVTLPFPPPAAGAVQQTPKPHKSHREAKNKKIFINLSPQIPTRLYKKEKSSWQNDLSEEKW